MWEEQITGHTSTGHTSTMPYNLLLHPQWPSHGPFSPLVVNIRTGKVEFSSCSILRSPHDRDLVIDRVADAPLSDVAELAAMNCVQTLCLAV